MSVPNIIPVDLIEDGLLWLINKAVFHPRGFALAQASDHEGNITFELWGNGGEPWHFEGFDEDAKFRAVEAAFAKVTE